MCIFEAMSKWIYTEVYSSPYGELLLGSYEDQLCLCDWKYRKSRESIDRRIQEDLQADYVEAGSPLMEKCKEQLNQYFKGSRKKFDLPVLLAGSDFQKRVWKALMEIPYGLTRSYLSLSRELGDEKAIRAVAKANGDNALSIIVPCHRILGSDGSLTGYAGGLRVKKKLLQLEGASLQQELNFND
jgi:methylated-DNA-[protein]-cysteine S-methyltransferase